VAISEPDLEKCLKTLDKVEMAEIRLDLTGFSPGEIKQVFSASSGTVKIATCRPGKNIGEEEQYTRLSAAIDAGVSYIDIEIEAEEKHRKSLVELAHRKGSKVIISYHNFEGTPEIKELNNIVAGCFIYGADIAKITTTAKSAADNARVLSLYHLNKPLVAFTMGEKGKISRVMAPFMGAVFTFAAMDDGKETAPGQIKYTRMKKIMELLGEEFREIK